MFSFSNKFQRFFGNENEEDETSILDDGTSLSWSTRVKGFFICFLAGTLFGLLGVFFFWGPRGLLLFAAFYTLGNIMAISSTIFLVGPWKQLQNMFKDTRLIATTIYLICIILTLLSAFLLKKKILVFVFCIAQFTALIWYALSYIPYARKMVKSAFSACTV